MKIYNPDGENWMLAHWMTWNTDGTGFWRMYDDDGVTVLTEHTW